MIKKLVCVSDYIRLRSLAVRSRRAYNQPLSCGLGILTTILALIILLFSASNLLAQDQPTIAKDSVQVTAFTLSSYKGDFKTFSWVPRLHLRVNGPIASGSQLYAEFTVPGMGSWVKFDCKTEETQAGRWWQPESCGGRDGIPEDKGITYTGPVKFAIKMRNELMGGDITLFSGTAKVAKVHSNETGPNYVNHFVYYVDQDWNLPIGYVFYDRDDIAGWNKPSFSFAFWARGEYWTRWKCNFSTIRAWNKTGEPNEGMFGPMYLMSENPGDYEVKILYNGHLVRSIKFTVDAEGKIVDNGIATSNKLGTSRVIVPVQVLGESDGQWNRAAWKTDAFYGNPLAGFTAVP